MLTKDIFKYEIAKHLNLSDIVHFSQTNRYYNDIDINELLISMINQRLSHIFGDKLREFLNRLNESGALISGSFIIQALLNEDWLSDLDIFIPVLDTRSKTITPLEQWLFDNSYFHVGYDSDLQYDRHIDKKIVWVRDFLPCKTDLVEEYKDWPGYNRQKNHIDQNGARIQVIQVDVRKGDLGKFIWDSFDFDICKNLYGLNKNKPFVKIAKLNEIFTKTTQFRIASSGLCNVEGTFQRAYKYLQRGIVFSNVDSALIATLKPDQYHNFGNMFAIRMESTEDNRIYRPAKGCNIFNIECMMELFEFEPVTTPKHQSEYLLVDDHLTDLNEPRSSYAKDLGYFRYHLDQNRTDCDCNQCKVMRSDTKIASLRHIKYQTRNTRHTSTGNIDLFFVVNTQC